MQNHHHHLHSCPLFPHAASAIDTQDDVLHCYDVIVIFQWDGGTGGSLRCCCPLSINIYLTIH